MSLKMNPEIKAQWVTALRSGEYRQAKGKLKGEEQGITSYCCLGVLCDLAVKDGEIEPPIHWANHWVYANTTPDDDLNYVGISDGASYSTLPNRVMEWSGLSYHNPSVQSPTGEKTSLANLNDDGYSFSDIADLIEENF